MLTQKEIEAVERYIEDECFDDAISMIKSFKRIITELRSVAKSIDLLRSKNDLQDY